MKINPDQIKQIQDQNQQQEKLKAKQTDDFARFLEQELTPEKRSPDSSAAVHLDQSRMQTLHTQLKTQGLEQISNQSESEFMDRLEQILGQWENYSQQLQEEQHLRQSYATLQDISREIENLKQNSSVSTQNPELENLLSELEIMSITEEIKFNRGDYL